MADLVGSANWAIFKNLIGVDSQDMFAQDTITWKRQKANLDRYGGDGNTTASYTLIDLKCQFSYNYFRQWSINKSDESGDSDEQNEAAIFTIAYLDGLGLLTANKFLDFDPGFDRFQHRGVWYKSKGDTFLSQAQDSPLLIMIILEREEVYTGYTRGEGNIAP